LRKLAIVRTLCIGIALAMLLGLVGVQEARGAPIVIPNIYYMKGGTMGLEKYKSIQSDECPYREPVLQPPYGSEQEAQWLAALQVWKYCNNAQKGFINAVIEAVGAVGVNSRPASARTAQAGGSSIPTLNSSTPLLPFLGNQLVGISYVPNATTLANTTAAYEIALRRQSDCSLDEDFILPGASTPDTPNADYIGSLTEAQDYFHQLSGLATTPDVFANGCGYQTLGLPSTANVLLLGIANTPDAGTITGSLTGNGELLASVTDTVANTFTTTTLSTTANGAFSAADLRGIGIMDLVATFVTDPATQAQSTAVFLGNGDGTFQPGVYYDVPGDITIDDVTGDGIPDIVVCGITPGITTLIGKGNGTFTASAVSATSIRACGPPAGQVLAGVFTASGKKDVLAQGTVLLGAGDGTFTAGSPITATPTFNFGSSIPNTAVADLDNDGKLDVVISEPGYVAIFYGNGDGTFRAGPLYAGLPDFMQVTITDIDGDGNLDIFLGTSSGGIYTDGGYDLTLPMFQILMGRGDGTFVDSLVYNQGLYSEGSSGNSSQQIVSADFTGDGNLDVLVFGLTGGLVVLPGDGMGNLGTPIPSSTNVSNSNTSAAMAVAAHINGDTKTDLVLAGSGKVALLFNQGDGTFAGEQDYTLPNAAVSLAVGDFNGDGLTDIAVGMPGGVQVMFGQANGTLGPLVKIDSSTNPTGLAAGSLTTDGRTDLVVADQGFFSYVGSTQQINGALHVYLGNANKTFTTVTAPTTSATNYTVAALGDLNHDGKLDLIVAGNVAGTSAGTGTPNVYTLLGKGDGTFQAANTLALAGPDGIGATSIALADFDNSGNLGVAVGNPNDFTEVLLGNGDGTLTDTLPALGQRPTTIAAADLIGNGYPELLVGTNDTEGQGEDLTVLLNQNEWTAPGSTSPQASTTRLQASSTSISGGQSVTLTATVTAVSGTTVPTGMVTFFSRSTPLGTETLNKQGVAVLDTSTLPVGADPIAAIYSGDANFTASAYTTGTVITVSGPATQTALASSLTPSLVGQAVTLTATVTSTAGTPSGTVAFLEGDAALGYASLDASAQAVLVSSTIPEGIHSITAVYEGSTGFGSSTSPVLTQIVAVPGGPPLVVSLSSYSVTAPGSQFTLTVTGENFSSNADVLWNGQAQTITSRSSTQLTATIPSTELNTPGTYLVTVANGAPTPAISTPEPFTVLPASPGPPVAEITGAALVAAQRRLHADAERHVLRLRSGSEVERKFAELADLRESDGAGGDGAFLGYAARLDHGDQPVRGRLGALRTTVSISGMCEFVAAAFANRGECRGNFSQSRNSASTTSGASDSRAWSG
jgi:hypothetical protein